MTDNLHQRARAVFLELSTLDGPLASSELDRLVGNDAELRAAVVSLLDARQDANEAGLMTDATQSHLSAPITESAGTVIGHYKILQRIGEGGFGSVFLAEQSHPVRRRVAIKIIKLGMDTKQVIARFEAERQALALMDHPHIARVFDAGATDSGRPYFAMEYVVGDAITKFADAYKLDIPARLALFAQICSAVQHAHAKGVIHRDLKPANVLVSMVDGKPFAKVIDFGIAKATASPLTEKTLFTEHRQLIGTPEYMSPEQADGSPDIDTRTDVYALGVLLYELLTGATPFDAKRLRSAAWGEMQRIIREEEPPAPSLRLSRDLGAIASTAAARGIEPTRLSTAVRGELDWVVMKALEKERARRYDTPAQLAEDVGRHLRGEPVAAAPPSRVYKAKKFVRRNKGPVTAASAVAATLLIGLVGTGLGWLAADEANTQLLQERALAKDAIIDILVATKNFDPQERSRVMAAENVSESEAIRLQAEAWAQGYKEALPHAAAFNGFKFTPEQQGDIAQLASVSRMTVREAVELRNKLQSQTNLATKALSDMFLLGTGTPGGMAAGLPRLPEIRDEPGTKLSAHLMGQSGQYNFEFWKRSEDGSVNEPLEPEKVLTALADTAMLTLEHALNIADNAEWSAYTANLALAQQAIEAGNYPEAREYLAACPESKRGWEWDLLENGARLIRHRITTAGSSYIGLASDGEYAFSYGLNAESLPMLSKWRVADGLLMSQTIAFAPFPGDYYIPNTADGKGSMQRNGHIPALASPGARLVLGLDVFMDVQAFDTERSAIVPPSGDPALRQAVVALDDTGSVMAFGLPDGSVTVWRTGESKPIARMVASTEPITALAMSTNGEVVFVGNRSGQLSAVASQSGKTLANVDAATTAISAIANSSDGSSVVSASRDGVVRVWSSDLASASLTYRIPNRTPSSLAISPDNSWIAVGTDFDVRVIGLTLPIVRTVISQMWGEGVNQPSVRFSPDSEQLLIANRFAADGNSSEIVVVELGEEGGSISTLFDGSPKERLINELHISSILASAAPGPSGLTLTTIDGTRRLVADGRSLRFFDTSTESDPVKQRQLAFFRMDAEITNLRMTGDGTRLLIDLANGTARIWDIRDPSERRKDMQAAWYERVPARAYFDTLWDNTAIAAEKLLDTIIADQSLTPLRRLVAAEMLDERMHDLQMQAGRAFEDLSKGQTDKGAVLYAARGADVPPRVRERLVALAESWEFTPPTTSVDDRLAAEERNRRLAEANLVLWEVQAERFTVPESIDKLRYVLAERLELHDDAMAISEAKYWLGHLLAGPGMAIEGFEHLREATEARERFSERPDEELLGWQAFRTGFAITYLSVQKTQDGLRGMGRALSRFVGEGAPALTRPLFLDGQYPGPGLESPDDLEASARLWSSATPELAADVVGDWARYVLSGRSESNPMHLASRARDLMAISRNDNASIDRIARITGLPPSRDELLMMGREALAKAEAIIGDPDARDQRGIPWSKDPETSALLAVAKAALRSTERLDAPASAP